MLIELGGKGKEDTPHLAMEPFLGSQVYASICSFLVDEFCELFMFLVKGYLVIIIPFPIHNVIKFGNELHPFGGISICCQVLFAIVVFVPVAEPGLTETFYFGEVGCPRFFYFKSDSCCVEEMNSRRVFIDLLLLFNMEFRISRKMRYFF